MKEAVIQTLHPESGKKNKVIALAKYELVKSAILEILQSRQLSHTELMEAIHERVSDTLSGNAQWYGETVKLDLEARGLIQRSKTKPPVYSLGLADQTE